ncbi:MAG: tRNA (guanosine(37)-N1)-methyltransferase TrmD [Bacilli bacterium]
MKITVLTLFPEMFDSILSNSIIKRAISKGVVEFSFVNIRDFSLDKTHRVDTPPIGGGAGLIMKCQPIIDALKTVKTENSTTILFSPRGKTYNQQDAERYKNENKDLILICGHYEGIDERVNKYVDELVSIGDYVLTGGEVAAITLIDSITRLLDGAISKESTIEESFTNGLLEYPQYTEPYDYNGDKVPQILYCGNHEAIEKYRRKESLKITKKYRNDLFIKYTPSKLDKKLLKEIEENNEEPDWYKKALEKGKKFLK